MAETKGGRPIAASQRPTGGDKALVAGKKQFFRRKKVCRFCVEKIDFIDYKDVKMLSAFISERGKITPRRISGVCGTCVMLRVATCRRISGVRRLARATCRRISVRLSHLRSLLSLLRRAPDVACECLI